jgi:hypothetical protein
MLGVYICLVVETVFVVKLEREKNELPHLSADSEFYAHPHKLGI